MRCPPSASCLPCLPTRDSLLQWSDGSRIASLAGLQQPCTWCLDAALAILQLISLSIFNPLTDDDSLNRCSHSSQSFTSYSLRAFERRCGVTGARVARQVRLIEPRTQVVSLLHPLCMQPHNVVANFLLLFSRRRASTCLRVPASWYFMTQNSCVAMNRHYSLA